MNEKLREALGALKGGEKQRAYRLAAQVVNSDTDPEALELAWLVIAAAVPDSARKKRSYETVLQLNPENETARRALAKLGAGEEPKHHEALEERVARPQSEKSDRQPQAEAGATVNTALERLQEMAAGLIRSPEGEAAPTTARAETIPVSGLQILGLFACFLLALGVFVPLIRIPIAGQMNYFQSGRGDGIIVLALVFFSVLIILLRRYNWLWFTALPASTLFLFLLISFIRVIGEMERFVAEEMQDDLFGGLASLLLETVQIEWGWVVLLTGGLLLLSTAILGRRGAWLKFVAGAGAVSVVLLAFLLLARGSILELGDITAGEVGGENTRVEEVGEGEPALYEAGQLSVLQVHDPSAFYVVPSSSIDLEAPEPVRGTKFVAVEFEFRCSEETQVVCDGVPEAGLELLLADGRQVDDEWRIFDAVDLGEEDVSGGESTTGWIAFRVPADTGLQAVIVDPDSTGPSLRLPLPAGRDGYGVNHPWVDFGDGSSRLLPGLRRNLQDKGIDALLAHRLRSESNDAILLNVCDETSFYLDEEEALREHRDTVLDVTEAAAGYVGGEEVVSITMEDCSSSVGTEVSVLFDGNDVLRWDRGQDSTAQFMHRAFVSLD